MDDIQRTTNPLLAKERIWTGRVKVVTVITNKAMRPTVRTADKQSHKMVRVEYKRMAVVRGGADKSLAQLTSNVLITHPIIRIWPRRTTTCSLDWKNNWKIFIFRPTRRSLLPRGPGWTDNLLFFFLVGLQKLE